MLRVFSKHSRILVDRMRVVIIGGGVAGTRTALELRRLSEDTEVLLIDSRESIGHSPCSLPYFMCGEIEESRIFTTKPETLEENGVKLLLGKKVRDIDIQNKKVICDEEVEYDKLVLALGSRPFIPPIKGIEEVEFFTLSTPHDARRILRAVERGGRVAVIGAGMIGVEIAEALVKRGVEVTLIDIAEQILPGVLDPDMSRELEDYLKERGVEILLGRNVKSVKYKEIRTDKENISYDTLILVTGRVPNKELAERSGLKCGKGIKVNEYLEVVKDVFACGDCVEYEELLTGATIPSTLATNAVKQARVVAANILGEGKALEPLLMNSVSKVGDLYIGSCGISSAIAKRCGMKVMSAKREYRPLSHYVDTGGRVLGKMLCGEDGRILGAQFIGEENISETLNLVSVMIRMGVKVQDIERFDFNYNPLVADVTHPLFILAKICSRKMGR